MVSIVIIHHENISIYIIFVTLSCILSTVLNKIDFSIMAVLICIKKFPKVVGVITQLDFFSDPMSSHGVTEEIQLGYKATKKPYTIANS